MKLVNICDEDGLLQATNGMIDNPELAWTCADNTKKTVEDFRLENVIGQWADLCERGNRKVFINVLESVENETEKLFDMQELPSL